MMTQRSLAVAMACAVALTACRDRTPLGPPDVRPSVDAPRPGHQAVLEIKFHESLVVRSAEGAVYSDRGASLDAVAALLDGAGAYDLRPLFRVHTGALDGLLADAARSAGDRVPDLASWYLADLPEGADAEAVAAQLRALPEVAFAYPAPLPAPPPGFLASATPDFTPNQGYFAAAPGGTSAVWARTLPGGDGAGIMVVDLEYDWYFEHEDLALSPSILLTGDRYTAFGHHHGTAVMGQLVGRANGFGVTGGVPGATPRVASPVYGGYYLPALAIAEASAAMLPGDVLLLEQQTWGPNGNYVPLEWIQSVYEATLAATQAGRVVVAAAGNGGENLDAPAMQGRFDRTIRDSGALVVGAASPARVRLGFSCYGSRVDLHAWGMSVTTTGYGGLYGTSNANYYTSTFSGTSSASPIVTAAVAAIQGRRKAQGLPPLTGPQVRALLVSTGTPQAPGDAGHIGPFPNLAAALAGSGVPRGPGTLTSTVVSATQVQLAWADVDSIASSLSLARRMQQSDGAWGAWQTIATLPVDSLAYRDAGLTAGGTYRYRISACNDEGCSGWSAGAVLSLVAPAAPQDVGSTSTAATRAQVTWTDASTNETAFEIARRTRSGEGVWGDWAPAGARPSNATTYTENDLTPGVGYRFRVRACNGGLCSGWTVGPVMTMPVQPAQPGSVVATPVSATALEVTWADLSDDETGFQIERRSLAADSTWGPWQPLATTGANVVRYRDTHLDAGSRHRYRVRACGGAICSAFTVGAPATLPVTPAAPTGLAATKLAVGIRLTWTDASSNETRFQLQRRVQAGGVWGDWQPLVTLPPNTVVHDDAGASDGFGYRYRIQACDGPACSAWAVSPTVTLP